MIFDPVLTTEADTLSDAAYGISPLRNANRSSCIQNIKEVIGLNTVIIRWQNKGLFNHVLTPGQMILKMAPYALDGGPFKVPFRELLFQD